MLNVGKAVNHCCCCCCYTLLLLLQAAEELLAGVPDEVAVWGWKEPQAIFTLPFLYRVRLLVFLERE
jgi:hypothetical protein